MSNEVTLLKQTISHSGWISRTYRTANDRKYHVSSAPVEISDGGRCMYRSTLDDLELLSGMVGEKITTVLKPFEADDE